LREERRRLAAILAADVAGYSRLMAADESGTVARLRQLRAEVFEPKIAEFHGRIVGSAGDSLLVEFASAVEAVKCAIELQGELERLNAGLPEERQMVFRMGVNLGDVIAEDDTIHGDGVNVAARLEKLADPGGVCVGRAIYDQVKGKFACAYDDLGEQRVHNIPEPVHAFRVRPARGAAGKVPPAMVPPVVHAKPSIAVLPFTNMSGDPEQEYFSDGITEDIITELSRFHSLFVVARNSSFVYKGRATDAVDVGRRLNVQYVTEGSVRRAQDRVRVTAQLIDARTGTHLWAERFDRQLEDVFAVQDEVTRKIVTSIAPVLAGESLRLAKRKPPEDMQAYDYYLKAKPLVDNPLTDMDLKEAREFCGRAIRLDPLYARAHACKALSFMVGILIIEAEDVAEWRGQALLCAEEALALDPNDSVSHWAMGEATFMVRQYNRSLGHFARAISLNPNDADMLAISAFVHSACGDSELGLRHMEMALERNPSSPTWYNWTRAGSLYMAGRYDEAAAALELFGRPNPGVLRWRAAILVKLGRIDDARAAMQALLALKPDLTVRKALAFFDYLPSHRDYVDCLRRAGLPEGPPD
jgi:TolB-like protein/class 3 adenylate cyclase/tetratricopeptide (TPR) repeat protein